MATFEEIKQAQKAWAEGNAPYFEFDGEIRAEDVEGYITDLIQTTDRHKTYWLQNANFVAFYAPKLPADKGNTRYAQVRVVQEKERRQHECDWHFVITVNFAVWEVLELPQRLAVLDHELYHCQMYECEVPRLMPHDFEDFHAIITKHGLYLPSRKSMARAVQPHIPGLEREKVKSDDLKLRLA